MLSPALRMTMKQKFAIGTIPAIIWGEISDNVYLFVHGKKSRKEEAEGFAGVAVRKGYQVLSFDLPEHGDRLNSNYPCTVQNGVQDLCLVEDYAKDSWKHISLFACSLGVYFSLVAYQEIRFERCLFLSPILDMEHLIRNMMKWFWDNYTTDPNERAQIYASPLRAMTEQLRGLPPAAWKKSPSLDLASF